MVECLNCGLRRELPELECVRCTYTGWAMVKPAELVSFPQKRALAANRKHLTAV